jgi:hypothetical protein
MKTKSKAKKLSEEHIDAMVIAEAEDPSAWSKPVKVRRSKGASVSLPASLAERATFFARLHREDRLNDWLTRIITERVDLEEAAFSGLKRKLVSGARKSR